MKKNMKKWIKFSLVQLLLAGVIFCFNFGEAYLESYIRMGYVSFLYILGYGLISVGVVLVGMTLYNNLLVRPFGPGFPDNFMNLWKSIQRVVGAGSIICMLYLVYSISLMTFRLSAAGISIKFI